MAEGSNLWPYENIWPCDRKYEMKFLWKARLDQKFKTEFLYNGFLTVGAHLGTNTNFTIDFALEPEI